MFIERGGVKFAVNVMTRCVLNEQVNNLVHFLKKSATGNFGYVSFSSVGGTGTRALACPLHSPPCVSGQRTTALRADCLQECSAEFDSR